MTDQAYKKKAIADGWKPSKVAESTSLIRKGVEVWKCKRKLVWVYCRASFTKEGYSGHRYYSCLKDAVENKNLLYVHRDMYKN